MRILPGLCLLWLMCQASDNPPPLKAFITAPSEQSTRYARARDLLTLVGLPPTLVESYTAHRLAEPATHHTARDLFFDGVPQSSDLALPPRRSTALRYAAMTLTQAAAWQAVAQDPGLPEDGWALVLDEEVVVNPALDPKQVRRIVEAGIAAAARADHDFAYLGLCTIRCQPKHMVDIWQEPALVYQYPCCGMCTHAHVIRKRSAANFWGQIRAFKYQDPCVAINTGRCNSLTGLTKEVCCSSDRSPELLRKWHPDPRSKYDWGPEVWLLPYLRYHHVVGCVDLRKPASGDHGVFHKEREGTPRWSPKVMVPSKPQPLPLPLPVAAPKVVQPRMPPPLAHALPLVNESGPQQLLKSYIISHSSTSARFNWTQKLATRMGFESTFIEAYTSENMAEPKQFVHANIMFFRGRPDREGQHLPQGDKNNHALRYAGCLLSHIRAWEVVAADRTLSSDGWAVILEDDVATHPVINVSEARGYIGRTLTTADGLGQHFVYLGLCSLRCTTTSSVPITQHIVYNQPCCGMCTHAYAVKKAAAGVLWRNLRDFRYQNPCYGMKLDYKSFRRACLHPLGNTRQLCCKGDEQELANWYPDPNSQYDWGPEGWFLPYLRSVSVGCAEVNTLRDGENPDFGIFHQMRDVFPSIITKH